VSQGLWPRPAPPQDEPCDGPCWPCLSWDALQQRSAAGAPCGPYPPRGPQRLGHLAVTHSGTPGAPKGFLQAHANLLPPVGKAFGGRCLRSRRIGRSGCCRSGIYARRMAEIFPALSCGCRQPLHTRSRHTAQRSPSGSNRSKTLNSALPASGSAAVAGSRICPRCHLASSRRPLDRPRPWAFQRFMPLRGRRALQFLHPHGTKTPGAGGCWRPGLALARPAAFLHGVGSGLFLAQGCGKQTWWGG